MQIVSSENKVDTLSFYIEFVYLLKEKHFRGKNCKEMEKEVVFGSHLRAKK